MQEFKIEMNTLSRRRELRGRFLSWGTVVLLVAISVLLFALGVSWVLSGHLMLRYLFVFTVMGAVILAIIMAFRETLRRAEREMMFVLDGDGIVRRRIGWPDVKIGFSEVDTVREEMRWLVIYGGAPRKKIAVPNDVAGYEVIRAELAKHHSLSARADIPLRGITLPVISVLSWTVVVCFRDARVTIPAGVIGLICLTIGSRRLWILRHRGPKRVLMWGCLALIWFSAILLIYMRIQS